jgi:cell division protease FtsH
MVTEWGMSDEMGMISYSDQDQEVFLGKSWASAGRTHSEATQQRVDMEIKRIIDEQYKRAHDILENNRDKVEAMVKALMEYETIDADQIKDIMEGRTPRAPKPPAPIPPKQDKDGGAAKPEVIVQPAEGAQ